MSGVYFIAGILLWIPLTAIFFCANIGFLLYLGISLGTVNPPLQDPVLLFALPAAASGASLTLAAFMEEELLFRLDILKRSKASELREKHLRRIGFLLSLLFFFVWACITLLLYNFLMALFPFYVVALEVLVLVALTAPILYLKPWEPR